VNGSVTTRKKREYERSATLSDHHRRLLILAYFWRYLTAPLIHRLLSDQYATKTITTAKLHARQLRDRGLFKEIRRSINQPYVYAVTKSGYDAIRTHLKPAPCPYTREEAVRPDTLDHELAISLQATVYQQAQARSDIQIVGFNRRYFHASSRLLYTDQQGTPRRLEPDLGCLLLIQKPNRWYLTQYFFELDMGTESSAPFGNKLDAYALWLDDNGADYLARLYADFGSPDPTPNFRLLIATRSRRSGQNDLDRLACLYNQALQTPSSLRRSTYLSTARHPSTSPLWYPVRHVPLKTIHPWQTFPPPVR